VAKLAANRNTGRRVHVVKVYNLAIETEETTAGSSVTFRMTARVAPEAANRNTGQSVHVVLVYTMIIKAEKTTSGSSGTFRMTAWVAPAAANRKTQVRVYCTCSKSEQYGNQAREKKTTAYDTVGSSG
jgi:uncharacterized Fe-S cluster protein YjdI